MKKLSLMSLFLGVLALCLCASTTRVFSQVSTQATVVSYGQRDSRWSGELINNVKGSTIGKYGCAITSVGDIRQYFSGSTVTPHDMNQWLMANGGYSGDLIIWSKVKGYITWRDYSKVKADTNYINSQLDKGYLLVAETRLSGSMHFVVLRGHTGTTYQMCDPWYGDSGKTFNDRYGDPGRWIYSIRVYGK